jgi:hypothetical protein
VCGGASGSDPWHGCVVAAFLGVLIYGVWWFARERGDDDRHTLW